MTRKHRGTHGGLSLLSVVMVFSEGTRDPGLKTNRNPNSSDFGWREKLPYNSNAALQLQGSTVSPPQILWQ